jgi:putative ABC transport system permease protein
VKFLPLIWAGLWRRPARTALTMISVISAFMLFGVLQGFSSGLNQLVTSAHADRLITQSQVSNIDPLPVAMAAEISRTPGVKLVGKMLYFGGPLRRPNEFIGAIAMNPDELRALDDQLKVTPEGWAALRARRTGALVSTDNAELYDLKIGDRLPLKPQLWANHDGTHLFPVDIVGLYVGDPADPMVGSNVILNYDYVDQLRAPPGPGTVNVFVERIADPREANQVAAAIDRLSTNSAHPTRTFSERQLAQESISSLGQVGLAVRMISIAVFFALLFSVGAVMIQAGRERTAEFSTLKTLGFTDPMVFALILVEAVILCLFAASLGLAASRGLYPIVVKLTGFRLTAGPIFLTGFAVAAMLALICGSIPAWRASRLSIVDGLADR